MAIQTLRRFLTGAEEAQSYRHVADILLRGIEQSVVQADPNDVTIFHGEMQRINDDAPAGCDIETLTVAATSAVQALEAYNVRTARCLRQKSIEFQNIMGLLAETVIKISGGEKSSINALNELRVGLESVSGIDDVRKIKAQLGECLRGVCEETERQRAAGDALVSELQRHIERMQDMSSQPAPEAAAQNDFDQATGLPNRHAAEAAVQQALQSSGRKYLATAVVDRLQSINARFGNEVGDTVLKALADRMRKEFHAGDLLFRWNGPTLVALLPREETIDEMRRTVKRTFEVPFEMDFYLRGRQIMLPVAAAWSVVRIIPPASTVFGYIERFVATQSPRDYC